MKKMALILALVVAAFAAIDEAGAQGRPYDVYGGAYQGYNGGYSGYSSSAEVTIDPLSGLDISDLVWGALGGALGSLSMSPAGTVAGAGAGVLLSRKLKASGARESAQTPVETWSWRYDSSGKGGWVAEGRQTKFSRPDWVGVPPAAPPSAAPAPQSQTSQAQVAPQRACTPAGCWVLAPGGQEWKWEPAPAPAPQSAPQAP